MQATKTDSNQNVHSNEFTRFWEEGHRDAQNLAYKYPIITIISTIAFAAFGFMQLFSFSIACIPSGVFFIAAAYGLVKTAFNCKDFFFQLFVSALEVLYLDKLLERRADDAQASRT